MKLPEKIKGRNKIRDGAIVLYFKREGSDFLELTEMFKLTERRIRQILAKNNAFIKRDKEWEKEKRINLLNRRLKTANPTSKDELEILSELRKEIEGDESGQKSRDSKIIIIYPPSTKQIEELNADRTQRIPSSVLA